jgi:hypothetical protein
MDEDFARFEDLDKPGIRRPEMADPDRRVDQDHFAGSERRRGTGRRFFIVPPRAARHRALSRAIRDSRPRRTSAVFSRMPVSSDAVRRRPSSMFNVVLICIYMLFLYISVKSYFVSFSPFQ